MFLNNFVEVDRKSFSISDNIVIFYFCLKKLQLELETFSSVIANVISPAELAITQVNDQVKIRLISQLIKGIARVLQKLLKYLNGTTTLNLLYYRQHVLFLLFLPWISMIQNLLK